MTVDLAVGKITNKEISWLSFNARVLQEAADSTVPLIERLKFLGIFSSNLDEFYRVRVATLKRLSRLGKRAKKIIGQSPKKILKEIQDTVLIQNKAFEAIYQEILKQLAAEGIFLINERQLDAEQREFLLAYFRDEVRPKLIPLMIDQVNRFPELRDQSIYLAVCLSEKSKPGKAQFALIELPTDILPRFLILPQRDGARYLILLDDVVRFGLKDIFAPFDFDLFEAYTVKITRDAELDIDDDVSESVIKKVSQSLKTRKQGSPVRLIYDSRLPSSFLRIFVRKLRIDGEEALIPGGRYHNFRDFMKFPDFGLSRLRYKPEPKLRHPDLHPNVSLFEVIAKKDLLLHWAYHSFDHLIDLLREAAIDPKVTSIKMTIYRAAQYSSVLNCLINAAKNGKSVVVLLELRARFDEAANIAWADRLREEGVRVIFGVQGLKVHCKMCLISRRQKKRQVLYAVLGTGNFNEETAKIYSDHALLTANKKVTQEVHNLFEFFETTYKLSPFRQLIVSPFNTRKKIIRLIQSETMVAEKGNNAWIFLKANNLTDPEMIQALYEAGRAGVRVRLIIRSMFSLQAGVPGLSENIEAVSIVDKYLEHTRIFVFANGGKPLFFLSSADLMPRNLDQRIEVTFPIFDPSVRRELESFLDLQWKDNVKARLLDKGPSNQIRSAGPGKKARAQWAIHEMLTQRKFFPEISPELIGTAREQA
jgi:polyphosphate kinase